MFFNGILGVALGEFDACRPPKDATWTLAEVLTEEFEGLGVPVLADLPFGHAARNQAFRWGDMVRIQGDRLSTT